MSTDTNYHLQKIKKEMHFETIEDAERYLAFVKKHFSNDNKVLVRLLPFTAEHA